MTVKLNRRGFEFATSLVRKGKLVLDERDDWSEHRPSAKQENEFIERHTNVHRCALLAAESRAGQREYVDTELAVTHLHGRREALRAEG
jgi:hypothetical protein